ncbi:MAG: OprO/OprP family phosphate-selective porin [Planctomycetota bacterium]|nr:OprO/OprP family phosphate-selective porin [Planctomycetota bacterium]
MQRLAVLFVVAMVSLTSAYAEVSDKDFSDVKKEIEGLRARLAQKNVTPSTAGPIGRANALIDNKYGPNATVTTKDGKLTMSGLIQVWWTNIQNDTKDFTDLPPGSGNSNEFFDNDSYRVRRAELKFTLDITPHITAVIMVDPTGQDEFNSFPGSPTNQGIIVKGSQSNSFMTLVRARNPIFGQSSSSSDFGNPILSGTTDTTRGRVQNGTVVANRLLQDAYINYHPHFMPQHDFTIGQFKPPMSEEGWRNTGQLDFAERAMINQFPNQRDLGIMVHGTWWEGRFQYWLGAFDSPGSFHNSFGSYQNRSDDNDAKDVAWRLMVRPVWHQENWGSLELGFSRQDGVHGEAGKGGFLSGAPVDGLSFQETHAYRQWAWAWYRPGWVMRGFWLRGEYGKMKDRYQPIFQDSPQPYDRTGWYAAVGYHLGQSIWADKLESGGWITKYMKDLEFAMRYEEFQNMLIQDDGGGKERTNAYKTSVLTLGLNYYWKGHNVRSQLNYSFVNEVESSPIIREVDNNQLILTHQVQW